jgi:hypothetical protein
MNDGGRRFKLSQRGVTLALVSAALSGSALANTGRVDFAIGNVTVTNSDGQVRQLSKGNEVKTGDRISSSTDGRAQIRFSDGAFVSLQPNTEFDIKEFRYDGKADGTERAIFGLFKGALRTITGLVGRVNRDRYQISTPTATIGIRGTGGVISIGADGSTLVTGTSGIWTLTNGGGTLEIPAGSSGFVGNPNLPPKQTTSGPVIPPTQPPTQPATFVAGDVRSADGNQAAVKTPVLVTGPGFAVASHPNNADIPFFPTQTTFDSTGRMTSFTLTATTSLANNIDSVNLSPGPATSTATIAMAGTHADFGTLDGVIAWGRWIGDVTMNGTVFATYDENQGYHYVVGIPTAVTSAPGGGTFTYNLIGASRPTYLNGGIAPGQVTSATLTGNFTTGQGQVDFNMSALDGAGRQFNGSAIGMTMDRSTAGLPFTSANASQSFASGTGCPSGCGFNVSGFFAGNGATHAGVKYSIGTTVQGDTLIGTVALKR